MKIRLTLPMTRIEGGSTLIVTREKENITNVTYNMPTARDFKGVLLGQQAEDLPKIVPRICGICPIAHRIGALKAIEAAFDITIPPTAELLRELALLGEIIRSHTYSVFFSTLPDVMFLANQISRKDILGIDRTQPRILPIITKLYHCAETLITATAGNTNMAFNLALGGLVNNITITQQQELIHQLHSTLSDINWAKDYYNWLLSEIKGETQHFTLPRPLFISCFNTLENRFSGTNQIDLISEDGAHNTFLSTEFSRNLIEQIQPEAPTGIAYTTAGNKSIRLLAGPHARLASLQRKSTKEKKSSIGLPNLFYAGLLRLDEIKFAVTNAIKLLETEWQASEDVSVSWQPKPGIGASAVEAPRGILLYRIEINNTDKVQDIDIRVPTELNATAISLLVKTIMTACLDLGWIDDQILERVQMAVRCFDPCVSCATHTDIRFRD